MCLSNACQAWRQLLKSLDLMQWDIHLQRCLSLHECEMVHVLTNHASNGAEEHRALSGRRGLAEILQHQRAVAEDIDKLTEVEHPHLLQMLPVLIRGGGTDQQEKKRMPNISGQTANIDWWDVFSVKRSKEKGMTKAFRTNQGVQMKKKKKVWHVSSAIDRLQKRKTSRVETLEEVEKVKVMALMENGVRKRGEEDKCYTNVKVKCIKRPDLMN